MAPAPRRSEPAPVEPGRDEPGRDEPGRDEPGRSEADRRALDRRRVDRRSTDRRSRDLFRRAPRTEAQSAAIAALWDIELSFGSPDHASGRGRLRRRDTSLRRALALSDVIVAFLALLVGVALIPGSATGVRPAALLLAPFVVLVAKTLGLYDRDEHRIHKTTIDDAPALMHVALIYALTVWLAQDVVLRGDLGRAQVLGLTAATLLLMLVCRAVARRVTITLNPPERCLLVGDSVSARQTAHKLTRSTGVKAEIVGSLALGAGGVPSLETVRALRAMVRDCAVERVVIAPDGHEQDEVLNVIRLVKALGVKVSVVPRLMEVIGTSSVFDEIQGTTLLGVRQYGLSKSSEIIKRTADIVLAGAALLVLSPLLALVAAAICLDSRGGPFYRQPRIGRHGDRFSMFKFRSMVTGADAQKDGYRQLNEAEGGLFKIAADPRITRVGRLLRRSCLDELPQLINVLRGEMSLVGPRPLVVDEDALIEGWERRRLAVKPGMTGLWQIFGSARIPMSEMVKIDYIYGANWSVWLDLKILLRTIPYVLSRGGM